MFLQILETMLPTAILKVFLHVDKLPFFSWVEDAPWKGLYNAEIPAMSATKFDANPQVGFSPLIPSQLNYKPADSMCLPNHMFQMTIEKSKYTKNPINVTKLLNVKELNILYCVPHTEFYTFSASIVIGGVGKNNNRILNNSQHRKFVIFINSCKIAHR
jgi:hypothetical protein